MMVIMTIIITTGEYEKMEGLFAIIASINLVALEWVKMFLETVELHVYNDNVKG